MARGNAIRPTRAIGEVMTATPCASAAALRPRVDDVPRSSMPSAPAGLPRALGSRIQASVMRLCGLFRANYLGRTGLHKLIMSSIHLECIWTTVKYVRPLTSWQRFLSLFGGGNFAVSPLDTMPN